MNLTTESDVASNTNATLPPKPATSQPKSRRKLTLAGGALIGCAIVVVAIVGLIIGGVMYVGIKDAQSRVVIQSQVCNDEVISKFNVAMDGHYANADNNTVDIINGLVTEFSKNPNENRDATCQFIKFQLAILQSNYDDSKSALDRVKELAEEGLYINGSITGQTNFQSMNVGVDFLKPMDDEIDGE